MMESPWKKLLAGNEDGGTKYQLNILEGQSLVTL